MTNMPLADDIIRTAQTLSKQELHVLWIIVIIVLCIAFYAFWRSVVKHHVQQHQALILEHKEARTLYHTTLTALIKENHEIMKELAGVMKLNTEALNRCTDAFTLFVARGDLLTKKFIRK